MMKRSIFLWVAVFAIGCRIRGNPPLFLLVNILQRAHPEYPHTHQRRGLCDVFALKIMSVKRVLWDEIWFLVIKQYRCFGNFIIGQKADSITQV